MNKKLVDKKINDKKEHLPSDIQIDLSGMMNEIMDHNCAQGNKIHNECLFYIETYIKPTKSVLKRLHNSIKVINDMECCTKEKRNNRKYVTQ